MLKKILKLLMALSLFSTVAPLSVGAASLDDFNTEEESVRSEMSKLENTLTSLMDEVNNLNNQINNNKTEIAEQEASIVQTAEDISNKEAELSEKYEAAKEQARNVQLNQMNQNAISMILSAESISDVANMVMGLNTLFNASTEDIELVEQETEKLNNLKAEQDDKKVALSENKATLDEQKVAMDEKVGETQQLIAENETELAEISARRVAFETEQAERAAVLEQENQPEQEQAVASESTSSQATASTSSEEETSNQKVASISTSKKSEAKTGSSSSQTKPAQKTSTKPSQASQPKQTSQKSSGRQVSVNATAYSTNQPGLSTHTAMGIDLRQNPYVIAVDPSVIPLGSMVEVPGYGIRIAGDTGGAIKGNRIDIHLTDLGQARAFGRQQMTVTVVQ